MHSQLAHSAVVIVAKHFNPSVVSQLWLVDHGVVLRPEFEQGSVYTDMIVNVSSSKFGLLVAPDQLQFVPKVDLPSRKELLLDRLGKLVTTIPHTPFTACGLNFIWHLRPDDVEEFGRQYFCIPGNPLFSFFESSGSRFGSYMSCDAFDGRLKLDVKPISVQTHDERIELMQFSFNFHQDVAGKEAAEQVLTALNHWDEAFAKSEEIMTSLNRKTVR